MKKVRTVPRLYPFGKGDLTANGEQYSDVVTEAAGTHTAVETISNLTKGFSGDIVDIKFSLTCAVKSSDGVNDVYIKWRLRNHAGTWVTMETATVATPDTTYVDDTVAGVFEVTDNCNTLPLDIQCTTADEDGNKTASCKVKSTSWVDITYYG